MKMTTREFIDSVYNVSNEKFNEALDTEITFDINPTSRFPFRIAIPSSDGKSYYTVVLESAGFAHCQCKGYEYRQSCKHIKVAVKLFEGRSDGNK